MKKARLILCITAILIGVFMGYRKGFSLEDVNYPTRDILCIVPFVPGGACDVVARSSAPYLRRYLPRQVNIVVQNVGAAGGRVGAFQTYDAKPDGYTISVMEPMVFVVAEVMGESQRKITHMNWLPRASTQPFMMGFSSQSPIKTVEDLKKAKRVRVAVTQSIIAGTIAFLEHLGINPQPVMYGGGAEACLAVMRGDVDLVILISGTMMRHAEASDGRLIPKAVFSEKRLSFAPNVPTVKETGLDVPKGIMPLLTFDLVYAAPYGLQADVHKVLNEAIEKTLRDAGFAEIMEKAKLPLSILSSEEMQNRIIELYGVLPKYADSIRRTIGK